MMRGWRNTAERRCGYRPTPGMRITSSLRPVASVACSSGRAIGVQGLGVGVVGAAGDWQATRAGRHEAGEVVDMAVGVVVLQAFAQPEHFLAPSAWRSAASASSQRPAGCGWG